MKYLACNLVYIPDMPLKFSVSIAHLDRLLVSVRKHSMLPRLMGIKSMSQSLHCLKACIAQSLHCFWMHQALHL